MSILIETLDFPESTVSTLIHAIENVENAKKLGTVGDVKRTLEVRKRHADRLRLRIILIAFRQLDANPHWQHVPRGIVSVISAR